MKKGKVFIAGLAASLAILTAAPLPTFAASYEYSYVGSTQVIGTVSKGTSGYAYYGGARTSTSSSAIVTQATVTAVFADGTRSNYSDYYYRSSYIQVTSARGSATKVNGGHFARGNGQTTNFSSWM